MALPRKWPFGLKFTNSNFWQQPFRGSPYRVNFRTPFTNVTLGGIALKPLVTKLYSLTIGGTVMYGAGSVAGKYVYDAVEAILSSNHPIAPGIELNPEAVY